MKDCKDFPMHKCERMKEYSDIKIYGNRGKWYWMFRSQTAKNAASIHQILCCPYCGRTLGNPWN